MSSMIKELLLPIMIGVSFFSVGYLTFYLISQEMSKRAKSRIAELESIISQESTPSEDEHDEISDRILKRRIREQRITKILLLLCICLTVISSVLHVISPMLISFRGFTIYDVYFASVFGVAFLSLHYFSQK